jgi:hypothetical protein
MSRDTFRRALAGFAFLVALAAFAPAHAAGFTINDSGACASWTFTAPATLTCNPSAPPVAGAPTGCQGTATPNPVPAAGGTVTLGVTGCSGTPTYSAWTSGIAPPSGNTLTVPSYTGTSNRAIVASRQACDATVTTACVNVTAQTTQLAPASGGGGGGAGGAISCPGFANTIVIDLDYAVGVQSGKTTSATFGNTEIVVARFTTPATVNNYGYGGYLTVGQAEASLASLRNVALSTTACDFTPTARGKNVASGIAPSMFFSAPKVGETAVPPNLLPNTTYYFNVKNLDALGVGQCSSGNCPVLVTLQAR